MWRGASKLLLLAFAACAPDARTPKVLIIGIDGVRPDVLADVPTPHIDRLIATGSFSDSALTGLPTISGPGWSSMLIGVRPAKHGVLNNDFTTNRYAAYPDLFSRIEQVRPALETYAVADWLPLVSTDAGGPLIGRADSVVVLNGYDLGWPEADSIAATLAAAYLREADPDLAFVYLGNPDETSHHDESIGEGYRAAIALADRHVGWLIAALRSRPTYGAEDWLVLVSTDHGRRADGGHGGESPEERIIFYLASGPSAHVGRPGVTPNVQDVAVTAYAHLGIAIDPVWGLDGRAVGLRR